MELQRFRAFAMCLLATLGAATLAPLPAAAQARPETGLYVGGAVFGDVKRFSGDPTEPLFDGDSVGGGIVIGTSLHPRWDLQVGVDIPRFTETSKDRLVTLQKNTFTLQSITSNQALSVTTLARLRGAQFGRVQLGYLGGLSFVRLRRDSHTIAAAGTPAGLIPKPDATVEYSAAPAVGIDARISVARHLALVPGLHATVFRLTGGSGLLLRPRLGLRWIF